MANDKLSSAKQAKNDEFYTQYYDIENEVKEYYDYNPDVFRGKTVLLPCDDPAMTLSGVTSPSSLPRTSKNLD